MNKKFFDNEKAVEGGVVGILVLLVISLVFTACFTSWILFNAYGVQVSGIVLPSTTGQTDQNFLTGDTFPSNLIQKSGCWTLVNNVGAIASLDNSLMLFDGVYSSNNGVYYNKYRLDNSIKEDYSVILEWTKNTYIKVKVTDEGFYYVPVNSLSWFGNPAEKFYPYDNANQITDVTIETEYYPVGYTKDGLIFKINGVTAFRIPWNELSGVYAGADKKYYGGVVAENSGLIIKIFESINDRTTDGWEGFLGNGVAFIRTLFLITVWNISPAFLPWEINLIFIKTQVFGIIACAIAYIRG
jgi:hypothetical protein